MSAVVGGLRRAVSRVVPSVQASSALPTLVGQPTHESHPELLAPGELAPGIQASEFAARRASLAARMPLGSCALVPATAVAYMTGVIPYPYRQDADFLYLTGITQPGAVALITAGQGDMVLFVTDPDETRERWDGARCSAAAATDVFGAVAAYPMSELPRQLPRMLGSSSAVYYDAGRHASSELRALSTAELGVREGALRALRTLTHAARWRKSPGELALMARSSALAEAGLLRAMRQSGAPGVGEHHLAAGFERDCRWGGAARMAYPPVVASGADACTIHYSRNDKALAPGSALLFDGGCELHGYCSDVTRTWPVGGRFSPAQRDVYQVVHGVQQQLLEWCRPGATLRQLHEQSVRLLTEGVSDLGLLPGRSAGAIAQGAIRAFYPHSVGHWLGLDTHDVPGVAHDTPLQPGVTLTVEPGLYIPDQERYGALAGIGVRIEDVVQINDSPGCSVLSRSVPTDADSIEEFIARGRGEGEPELP
ncbi:ICP55 [Auxenochlorella protothecoides x Auxenochlorella symbiontica]